MSSIHVYHVSNELLTFIKNSQVCECKHFSVNLTNNTRKIIWFNAHKGARKKIRLCLALNLELHHCFVQSTDRKQILAIG
jgi:hypothetical protein